MPVKWEGDKFLRTAETAVEHALDDLVGKMVVDCRRKMKEGPQTGRDYAGWVFFRKRGKLYAFQSAKAKRGYKSSYVRSSGPGEFPAVQAGELWRSIAWDRAGRMKRRFGTSSKHGLYLEVGAPKARIKPRPYLRKTYRRFTGREAEVHFAGKIK